MPALAQAIAILALGAVGIVHGARLDVYDACVDDNVRIIEFVKKKFKTDVSGCGDARVVAKCRDPKLGSTVRSACCLSCAAGSGPDPNHLPPPAPGVPAMDMPPADNARPLHLYWMGGQSEMAGMASTQLLKRNRSPSKFDYSAVTGVQQDVWLAGLNRQGKGEMDSFFISKMQPGVGQGGTFGPELSFGHRIQELTGARVMIIKFARIGTNVRQQWNPAHSDNTWDYTADDGSASWLYATGNVPAERNNMGLFKTHTYLVRRTLEALDAAGVAYEWKGIIWSQGNADSRSSVEKFGRDTASLFSAIRHRVVHDSSLPIIDNGGGGKHKSMSGKHLAAEMSGNTVNVEFALSAQNHTDPCVPGVKVSCPGSTILNVAFLNRYGWDVGMPDKMKPIEANKKTSAWFKDYSGQPPDLHSEYEAMIRKGWMYADAFVQHFMPDKASALTADMQEEDPAIAFPLNQCADGEWPSRTKQCWVNCMKHPDVCAIWPSQFE